MIHKTFVPGALLAAALTCMAGAPVYAQSNSTGSNASDTSVLRRTQIGEVTNIGIDQVTIQINGRKPLTLKLNSSTKISIDGKSAAVDDIRRGDTVRVVTKEKDSSTAEMLDVAKDPDEEARVAQGGVPAAAAGQNQANRDDRDDQMPAVALGIAMADEPSERGVEVEQIHPGSPADRAGVRQGDVLISLDGKNVEHPRDVRRLLQAKRSGDRLQIVVKRNGENKTMSATLVGRNEIFGAQGQNPQQFGQPQFGQGQFGQPQFGQQFGAPGAHPTYRVERKAWLGLGLDDRKEGVEVERVYPSGPAARAGFEQGDIITAIDGKKISKMQDVFGVLDNAQPGGKAEFTVARDGKDQKLEVAYGDSSQFQFGYQSFAQGGPNGNNPNGHNPYGNNPNGNNPYGPPGQGFDQNQHFVPEHDMMLEFHRHMAVQNERLEKLVTELRDEVKELRKEVQQLKSK